MSASIAKYSTVELYEHDTLKIIMDNWGKMPEDAKDATNHIGDIDYLALLKSTYAKSIKKANGIAELPVKYKFSKLLEDSGRLYAVKSISLQSITRKIRHTIAGNIYNDIDMKNAHLSILTQYCKKKGYKYEEIEKSVINNEQYLTDLMKEKGISRDEAKRVKLSISYGSNQKSNVKWFEAFKKEINEAHKKMIEDPEYEYLKEKIRTDKKNLKWWHGKLIPNEYNTNGKLCGQIMCKIESLILRACIEYLKLKEICIKNIVLCFDGFMLPKNIFKAALEELEEMAKYAEKKTGYKMTFVNKPMDQILDLSGLKIKTNKRIMVENDNEATDLVLEHMGGKIFLCQKTLFVKSRDLGVWTTENTYIKRECSASILEMCIVNNKDVEISKNVSGIEKIRKLLIDKCPINPDLVETIKIKSFHKLFFKNGVYDFDIRKFREETNEDMTMVRINRDYTEKVDEEAFIKVKQIINDICDPNKENKDMRKCILPRTRILLQHWARALAGDVDDKVWIVGEGLRNSGKGVLTDLTMSAFGNYVVTFNAANLINKKKHAQDEDRALSWLYSALYARLLISNEMDVKNGDEITTINGTPIKNFTGKDEITVRTIYKDPITFRPQGRIVMLANAVPLTEPLDTLKNMSKITFPNAYLDEPEYEKKKKDNELLPYEKLAELTLKKTFEEEKYKDAFVHLVLESYINTKVEDLPEMKEEVNEMRKEAGDITLFYRENFDYSDKKTYTSCQELHEYIMNTYPTMTKQKINSFMTVNMRLEKKQIRINKEREWVFYGIKIKQPLKNEYEDLN